MSDINRRVLLGAAGLSAVGSVLAHARAAGPLNPPAGPVNPSGPTLDDVYNALPPAPVGAFDGCAAIPGFSNWTIGAPGSYVLIGNLPVTANTPGFTGLTISSDNVTLDLNGFSITGQSVAGGSGVRVTNNAKNVVIRNGHFYGINKAINIESGCSDILVEDLVLQQGYANGIYAQGNGIVVRRCSCLQIAAAATAGIPISVQGNGCTIEECLVSSFSASLNSYIGIFLGGNGGIVRRCTVTNYLPISGFGIAMSGQIAYRENTVINFSTKYNATNGAGSGGGNV